MHVPHLESFAPRLVLLPTRRGRRRLFTQLDPHDATHYRRVVGRVAAIVERALGPGVHADRVLQASPLAQEPWTLARRRFHRHLATAWLARPKTADAVVVRADVRNCFASIQPGCVERALRALGSGRHDGTAVRRLLEEFAEAGVPGLPVGPAPSGVLASAVLAASDSVLALDGAEVFRWVDDYVVLTGSESQAQNALERLRRSLDAAGLELAPEKTRILPAMPFVPFDVSFSPDRVIRLESSG